MKQVFYNLLSNAIKFSEGGIVDVIAEQHGNYIEVRVRDTGLGIPKEYLNRIFDRFFRVPDSGRHHHVGTGLGLAIAKGWTEAHGGRIWAESADIGKGTTFFIDLPLKMGV